MDMAHFDAAIAELSAKLEAMLAAPKAELEAKLEAMLEAHLPEQKAMLVSHKVELVTKQVKLAAQLAAQKAKLAEQAEVNREQAEVNRVLSKSTCMLHVRALCDAIQNTAVAVTLSEFASAAHLPPLDRHDYTIKKLGVWAIARCNGDATSAGVIVRFANDVMASWLGGDGGVAAYHRMHRHSHSFFQAAPGGDVTAEDALQLVKHVAGGQGVAYWYPIVAAFRDMRADPRVPPAVARMPPAGHVLTHADVVRMTPGTTVTRGDMAALNAARQVAAVVSRVLRKR